MDITGVEANGRPKALSRWIRVSILLVLISNFADGQTVKSRVGPNPTTTASDLSAKEIAKLVLPSVVLVMCDSPKRGSVTQGSGFFIAPGILVTNYHVIRGNTRGLVNLVSPTKSKARGFRIARIIAYDEESDLALLSVPSTKESSLLPSLELVPEAYSYEVGETIFALGNPEGMVGTISPGIVSADIRLSDKRARIQITAPISPGSSGGPVVNARGKVLGVAVGSFADGQNLNFAVPTDLIHRLVRRSSLPSLADDYQDLAIEDGTKVPAFWAWTVPPPTDLDTRTEAVVTPTEPRQSSPPPVSPVRDPARFSGSRTIVVSADETANGWTNSGIVVQKGQRIRVSAQGRVNLGRGNSVEPSGNFELYDRDKLLKGVPTGALIAVIGDDNNEFIYIGKERDFSAPRAGPLFLGINEGNLKDNTGNFEALVQVSP